MSRSSRRTTAGDPPSVSEAHEHGDVCRVFAPGRNAWTSVIHHPDDVKRVLVTNHRNCTRGVGIDRVRMLLGNGIMTSKGEFWRRQRRMLQPTFHRRIVQRFAGVIRDRNAVLLERWARAAEKHEPVSLTLPMSELALEIVLPAIFSEDLGRLVSNLADNPFMLVTRESTRSTGHGGCCRSIRGQSAACTKRTTASATSGWLLTRRSIGPDRVGGDALPPGTDLFLSPFVVHRHPAIWENAESFDPDRFGAGRTEGRHRFAYIPFGAGPRHCIGENLATFEMMLHMNSAARRSRLRPVASGPVALEARINLRPAQDIHMRVETR